MVHQYLNAKLLWSRQWLNSKYWSDKTISKNKQASGVTATEWYFTRKTDNIKTMRCQKWLTKSRTKKAHFNFSKWNYGCSQCFILYKLYPDWYVNFIIITTLKQNHVCSTMYCIFLQSLKVLLSIFRSMHIKLLITLSWKFII